MKILFMVPYSSKGQSNRFRVEQYVPYLQANGIECDIRPFVFDEFYEVLYSPGFYGKKIKCFVKAVCNRIADCVKINLYDIVFIQREACPLGPPIFEWLMHMHKKPIVFDFDDAIFLRNCSPANRMYSFMKFPSKTKLIIKMSKSVIVANNYLREYAKSFSESVHVIPTSIDTDRFKMSRKQSGILTVGWIGSPTNAHYLEIVYKAMQLLSKKYSFVLKIVGAGKAISIPGVRVENQEWNLDREIYDFQDTDIGIYPLRDSLWSRGKAAFKAIQYMSVGVPVVASPVGMTRELIQDDVNGYLAGSDEEWVEKLSNLLTSEELRTRMGLQGRKIVVEKYSVSANVSKLLSIVLQDKAKNEKEL